MIDIQKVDAETVKKHLQDTHVCIVDVRDESAFEQSHIPGAKNLNLRSDDFESQLETLDKNKTYIVHCGGGSRGGKAATKMLEHGFSSVWHFTGGMRAWKEGVF